MDDNKDKLKLKEILDEIENLANYSNELALNTRGEKLGNYVDNLIKNVTVLKTKVETIYEKEYGPIEPLQ